MDWTTVFKEAAAVEGSTFAGVANLLLVAFLAYTVRPKRTDEFAARNAMAFIMMGVVALLVCMAVLAAIGLL